MTDMFIPKKERILIVLESVIYVLLIIAASYFTIFGNIFIRMIPMLYILGILGNNLFNRPIITAVFIGINILVFGYIIQNTISIDTFLLSIYSASMIIFGEITGHILNVLYKNFKLRVFLKYYHKIAYIVGLIFSIAIPVFLNNMVNSNIFSYFIAKKNITNYIKENYTYTEMSIDSVNYIPSYFSGIYEFGCVIDNVSVEFNYNKTQGVYDVSMNIKKETFDKAINADMNVFLKENNLTSLDTKCEYKYSKILTIPDVVEINIAGNKKDDLDALVKYFEVISSWKNFDKIERVYVQIDSDVVTITKKQIEEKSITKEYLIAGTKQEVLNMREGN